MIFLDNYAWACWCYACSYILENSAFEAERKRVCELFRKVVENSDDIEIKCSGISGIVQCLNGMGKKNEALKYAEMYPDTRVSYTEREALIEKCLEGEEKLKKKQQIFFDHFHALVHFLIHSIGSEDAIHTAEQIIETVITDGNYLFFHHALMSIQLKKAKKYIKENATKKVVKALEKAKFHARELDRIEYENPGIYIFSSNILSGYKYNTATLYKTGTETNLEDFCSLLNNKLYDPLRTMPEFQRICTE